MAVVLCAVLLCGARLLLRGVNLGGCKYLVPTRVTTTFLFGASTLSRCSGTPCGYQVQKTGEILCEMFCLILKDGVRAAKRLRLPPLWRWLVLRRADRGPSWR